MPNALLRRRLSDRTPEFGKAFEHFLVLETIAAQSYSTALERLNYWRSSSGYEVDLLLNETIAVEVLPWQEYLRRLGAGELG